MLVRLLMLPATFIMAMTEIPICTTAVEITRFNCRLSDNLLLLLISYEKNGFS